MKYEANETMKFLGKQYPDKMINNEQYNQLKDIKAAYMDNHNFDITGMIIDAYILGYIMGKRNERDRRKKRAEKLRKECVDLIKEMPDEAIDYVIEQLETNNFRAERLR